MPAVTRLGLHGGPRAPYAGFSPAAATVALTGTVTSATEADIVAGGKTLILTLTNDTWTAAVGNSNPTTTAIINGLDSDGAEATGWDAVVKAGLTFNDVTRDSDTQVTILLPAFATYDITALETITATVPHEALQTTSGTDVVATPTFDVAVVADDKPGGSPSKARRRRKSRYPRWIVVDGKRYRVASAAEEAALLARLLGEVKEEAQAVVADAAPSSPKVKRVRQRVKRIEARIEQAERTWEQHLDDEDEELMEILFG